MKHRRIYWRHNEAEKDSHNQDKAGDEASRNQQTMIRDLVEVWHRIDSRKSELVDTGSVVAMLCQDKD